jgi:hypothetical protein
MGYWSVLHFCFHLCHYIVNVHRGKWYNNINALYSREVPLQCNTMENRCQTMVIETIIKYHVYHRTASVEEMWHFLRDFLCLNK